VFAEHRSKPACRPSSIRSWTKRWQQRGPLTECNQLNPRRGLSADDRLAVEASVAKLFENLPGAV
jgi:hypothetical protein